MNSRTPTAVFVVAAVLDISVGVWYPMLEAFRALWRKLVSFLTLVSQVELENKDLVSEILQKLRFRKNLNYNNSRVQY